MTRGIEKKAAGKIISSVMLNLIVGNRIGANLALIDIIEVDAFIPV